MSSGIKALYVVALVALVDLIGFGIVLPLLPIVATDAGSGPLLAGMLFSAFSLAQLFCAPFWGRLSDQIGRKPVMAIGMIGSALSYLLFAISSDYIWIFVSRLSAGIMAGNIPALFAYVSDVTEDKARAKGMGLIGAAFGVGFMLGPGLAAFLSSPGVSELGNYYASLAFGAEAVLPAHFLSGICASTLSGSAALLVLKYVNEPSRRNHKQTPKTPLITRWAEASVAFKVNCFTLFILISIQASLYALLPIDCMNRFGFTRSAIGWLYFAIGLVAIGTQGGLLRRLAGRFDDSRLLAAGIILGWAGLSSAALAPTGAWFFMCLALMTVGAGLAVPSVQSMISKTSAAESVGEAIGVSQSFSSLGRVIGPLVGGAFFGLFGSGVYPIVGICFIAIIVLRTVLLKRRGVN